MVEKKNSAAETVRIQWNFFCRYEGKNVDVCKMFLCKMFQVAESKIKSVQEKIIKGKSLADLRGLHGNHRTKLTDDLKALIQEHCQRIPHHESHYSREKTKLNYFDDSSITLHRLYIAFVEYYASVTGELDEPISEVTYAVYFNYNVPFSFGTPRTDVCNLCYTYEKNPSNKKELEEHKSLIEDYKIEKKSMLSTKSVLHLEFDFGQNLALPKLPVNEQFFCRLLWLYIFNVHVFQSENSYMFHCLEGNMKKGANSVCNFVEYVIKKELEQNYYNKIYLYSDAAGSQNRNYLALRFFSLLSEKYQI